MPQSFDPHSYIDDKFDEFIGALAAAAKHGDIKEPINFRRDLTWNKDGFIAVDLMFRFVPNDSVRFMADKNLQNATVEIV